MRKILLALAVVIVLTVQPTTAPVSFAEPCVDGCVVPFDEQRGDVTNPGLVPVRFQRSLLVKANRADRAIPTDPCRSLRHLRALSNEVRALRFTARISANAARMLQDDVRDIVAVLIPTDPC
jgi:hypothetical protein